MREFQTLPADEVQNCAIIDMGSGPELVIARSWIGDHTLVITGANLEDGRVTRMHKVDPGEPVRVLR
jgi:hypothetical protein